MTKFKEGDKVKFNKKTNKTMMKKHKNKTFTVCGTEYYGPDYNRRLVYLLNGIDEWSFWSHELTKVK